MSNIEDALNMETFSFADVVQGRSYPTDTVTLCSDEATAYDRGKYLDAVLEARGDTSFSMLVGPKREQAKVKAYQTAIDDDPEVAKKVEEFDNKLAKSTYTFHIQGVSDEHVETLNKKALAEIPPEYEQSWRNPATGQQVKGEEKPSPERNRLFTNLIWAAYIAKIVAPNGAVDTAPGLPAAEAIRKMPQSQQSKFNDAINKLAVESSAFEASVSTDF